MLTNDTKNISPNTTIITPDKDIDNHDEYVNNPDKFCEICIIKLNSHCIKLHCGHCFHYDCLVYSLQKYKTNSPCSKMHCPYCRQEIDYIPLLKDRKPIKNLHKEYEKYIEKENNKYQPNVQVMITTGKNKGQCGKICNSTEQMLTVNLNNNINIKIKKKNVRIL